MAGFDDDNYRPNMNYWKQGDSAYSFDPNAEQFGQEL